MLPTLAPKNKSNCTGCLAKLSQSKFQTSVAQNGDSLGAKAAWRVLKQPQVLETAALHLKGQFLLV